MVDTLRIPPTPSNSIRPFVSIIVVNYNGGEKLLQCLAALRAISYSERELIIVDNSSTDGSLDALSDESNRHPDLIVVRSEHNLGYAGAINLAMGTARGEYLAVLNMDVVVDSGWLEPLIDFLEEHREAGAVNPLIALEDGARINAMGQDLHITGLGFNSHLGRSIASVSSAPIRVLGIQGSAFVIRQDLFQRIGGMDSTGFLYHEDVNLSWLLNLIGFDLYCVPQSAVRHDYFLSMYPAKLHLLERNRWAMLFAYLHFPTLLMMSPALLVTELLMWAYCTLRGWEFMRAKAMSYRWVWAHRLQIAKRRKLADSLRKLSDWQLLKSFSWLYRWDQFLTLGRERGRSLRQPKGGVPKALDYR